MVTRSTFGPPLGWNWRSLEARPHCRFAPALASRIRQESYLPQGRKIVRASLNEPKKKFFNDPLHGTGGILKAKQKEILDLVRRAERLAGVLQARLRSLSSVIPMPTRATF